MNLLIINHLFTYDINITNRINIYILMLINTCSTARSTRNSLTVKVKTFTAKMQDSVVYTNTWKKPTTAINRRLKHWRILMYRWIAQHFTLFWVSLDFTKISYPWLKLTSTYSIRWWPNLQHQQLLLRYCRKAPGLCIHLQTSINSNTWNNNSAMRNYKLWSVSMGKKQQQRFVVQPTLLHPLLMAGLIDGVEVLAE